MSLVSIGKFLGAHGVKGQVTLRSFCENTQDIFTYDGLTDAAGKKKYQITKHGKKGEDFIVSVNGIADRNEAALLSGKEIYIPRDSFKDLDDGQYYITDLIGLNLETEEGEVLGEVLAYHNFGAGDLLEYGTPPKTEYFPFTDEYIIEIDLDAGKIIVSPPEIE